MLCGYLTGSRYGMNQSKASPRIEYTQVELNVPEFDRLLFVLLIDLGIILHDACLPALYFWKHPRISLWSLDVFLSCLPLCSHV